MMAKGENTAGHPGRKVDRDSHNYRVASMDPDRQGDMPERELTHWDTNPALDPSHPSYDVALADELGHEEAMEDWRRGPGYEPKPSRWGGDREDFHADI